MNHDINNAKNEFIRARKQAVMEEIFSRFTGKSTELLSFEEVREQLHALEGAATKLKDIPLKAIIGSVGRYNDFNRDFLPLKAFDMDRWATVKTVVESPRGAPPIDVYQVGEAYFVVDGNHRVSVARQKNQEVIYARVREVTTLVDLPANASPKDLIILSEYTNFLEETALKSILPEADLLVTEPNQYGHLAQQVEVEHFMLFSEYGSPDVPHIEGVRRWYSDIYEPIVQVIRRRKLLQDFPGRTETDLFVWLSRHRLEISRAMGWQVRPDTALESLADSFKPALKTRIRATIIDAVTLEKFRSAPATTRWRETRTQNQQGNLFSDLAVVLPGSDADDGALQAAIKAAFREESTIHGIFLPPIDDPAMLKQVGNQFADALAARGIAGELACDSTGLAQTISQRSPLVDLLVLPLPAEAVTRSGKQLAKPYKQAIEQSVCPLLLVPGEPRLPGKLLLWFDGSDKGREALFLAAYLCGFWDTEIAVAASPQGKAEIEKYLSAYHLDAAYLDYPAHSGEILDLAEENGCDWLVLGGYRSSVLGGGGKMAAAPILAARKLPILICN